jgi:cysteinyl-tRNA synthetase
VDVLGLKIGRDQRPSGSKESELDENKIEELIVERNQARESGDYARADEIRDSLFENGIVLEDSAQGTGWHRS